MCNIAIIGSTGGIGSAFLKEYAENNHNNIYAFSRSKPKIKSKNIIYKSIDILDENSIKNCAKICHENPLDIIILATGLLHDKTISPEKSLRDLNFEKSQKIFAINTIAPALIMKHFLPLLNREKKVVFAALSARVGSICDNHLGGWYSYRASKAALNMMIKTASIETARRNKNAIVIGLHPGTVDSDLSQPFQANVPKEKLFTAQDSARKLIKVIDGASQTDNGEVFAFDGTRIPS